MNVGIVGHEDAKFTAETESAARRTILTVIRALAVPDGLVVSGACHLGGIDVWAIEAAKELGVAFKEFPSTTRHWSGPGGYMERNLKIAETSDVVHVIVVRELPPHYNRMRFTHCYHCGTQEHVKSGACWTAKKAEAMGKKAVWHVV